MAQRTCPAVSFHRTETTVADRARNPNFPLDMPSSRKTLFALLLLTLSLLGLSGCVDPKQESSIPWNRPANWEGRIPGMGQ